MLVALIIALCLAVFCVGAFLASDFEEGWLGGAGVLLVLAFFFFVGAVHMDLSSQSLTGYIYSSSNNVAGYTTAHIRFSENAGTDAQPEFCVKADSDAGRAIAKYVGSGKKVKVEIPSYFYLANNPFVCGTTKMTVTEVK